MIVFNLCTLVISINSLVSARGMALTVNDILIGGYSRISGAQDSAVKVNSNFLRAFGNTDSNYNVPDLLRDVNGMLASLEQSVAVFRPDAIERKDYAEAARQIINHTREFSDLLRSQVVPLLQQSKETEAFDIYLAQATPIFNELIMHTMEIVRIQHEESVAITMPLTDPTPIYMSSALAIFATILAIVMAIFISNYIASAINQQIIILEKMAEGDLSLHISDGHNDEFGRTYTAMRKMRTSLNDIVVRTQKECDLLQNMMRSLQGLSSSIVNHSSNVESQAISVSASSDQMVSTTQNIARNCESAASNSSRCKNISDKGMQQVIASVNSIREQSEQTKDNAQKIENLAKQTREIGSIVSTIDDIAAQTNLLALNAAIEAARAGSAGRGFAVVADEVRALASRTTASTQEISKMVKNIQTEAALATESISTSVVNMEGVADEASKTEQVLKEITDLVIEVNSQITQIATAAEEQSNATGEISSNMQSITHAANQMTGDASDQNTSMDGAYQELEQLVHALSFFKTRAIQ